MNIKSAGKRHDVDMTEGSIFQRIIGFALPLLIGNIFQQLYNMVDTWVVGNYVSNAAFSAVGTVGPIINMLIGIFMGLASGAGVVISQYYGAKDEEQVSRSVHTSFALTLVLAVLFTGIGIGMTPTMLRFMNTPEDVFPESQAYLTIYFSGMIGLMVYNMGSGVLRAVGDSQRPFYFLVVSACLNIVLDLLFVLRYKMGVEGVAYATIISQGVSAVLVTILLVRTDSLIKLTIKKLWIHMDILWKIIRVGIPAALQMAITSFSNVFVQSYINQFGSTCMGGWTAYAKIDQLVMLPMQAISLASTTFVGQNLGSNQVDRAKRGVRVSLMLSFATTAAISVVVILLAPNLVQIFNQDPEVIAYGGRFLRVLTPFYILCCMNQILAGALRGAGNSKAPMVIMLLSFVLFRQCYLFVMSNFISNTIIPIAMGYPAGWLVCSTLEFVYYKKVGFGKNNLIEKKA